MKRGLTLFVVAFIFLLLIAFSSAQENDTAIDNARNCLKDKIGEDCDSLTTEQQIFSILSLGEYQNCKESFLSDANNISQNQECWPSAACKPKQTALALIALRDTGEAVSPAKNWLLNQTQIASDLIWFLQVESDSAVSCSVTYGGNDYDFKISEDKKISKDAGNCLKRSSGSYWYQIQGNSECLNHKYQITCDNVFKTNLLYKTQDSTTIHVSQIVHTGDTDDTLEEKINYQCFKKGGVCDFESSLWAVFVLSNYFGEDVSNYLPYLEASYKENSLLFPEAFLFGITNSKDYLNIILKDNFQGDFWSAGSGNKFYDTALAFSALQGGQYSEVESAKSYLKDTSNQNQDGCWGSLVDTGFLLYAGGWGESISPDPSNTSSNESENETSDFNCESSGFYCVESSSTCTSSGGQVRSNFLCEQGICCSESPDFSEETCEEQGGEFCQSNETCPFSRQISSFSDGESGDTCCEAGFCEQQELPKTTPCEQEGFDCKSKCGTDEKITDYSCGEDSAEVCCKPRSEDTEDTGDEEGKFPWWIFMLLFLIILVILAIVFRNKIKLFFFKIKSKFKSGKPPKKPSRPRFPPGPRPPAHRPPMPPLRKRPQQQGVHPKQPPIKNSQGNSSKDKEFDETLKKLRDMSK